MKPSSGIRKTMIVAASMACVFYLVFRAAYTFNTATPYAWFASIFLYVGELFGIMNLLLYFLQVWEVKEPPMMPVIEGRTVDVFVPTYNEDPQLLRVTLEACLRMDYPHRTFVLDDGRRPEVESLANELGVAYITRQDNRHAKAGNLNNAFEQTDGEFVIILDADHVPEPQFITRLIGYFGDERVGFVQTPHAFYNFDSFQAQLNHRARKYWEEGDLFYRVIQPGRNHWNAPIFAGSAAMFRRSSLRDIGYIAVETITEDLHTGLRMHSRGWRGIAITERLIAGQAAPDITTFHAQRLRWGEGNLSIIAYDNPLTMRGLSMPQRLCYFGSMIHWASGLFKLAIYLTPILMLFTGVPPVKEFTWELALVTVGYLVISLMSLKVVSNGYGSILNSELFSMVNFWTQIKATFRAVFRRRFQRFVVTPKRTATSARPIWPFIRPQTYLIIAGVLALFWGWSRLFVGISDDYYKPIVPTFWVLLIIFFGYLVTRRAFWPADKRYTTRHVVHLPVEYETGAAGEFAKFGVSVDLNDAGMALIAYERIPSDREMRITLRGAGEVLKLKGDIRSVTELARGRSVDGYRYGIAFKNMTAPQVDAINRVCLQYAVPRMYAEYDRGNQNTGWFRFMNWQDRGMAQRRASSRYPYHLPLILNPGTTEETACYSSTEDLSRDAAATFVDSNIPPNAMVGFLMPTPLGDVRGIGRIIRTQPQFFGGRNYYRTIVEFQDFEGQGRTTLHSLVNPAESAHLNAVLKPDKKPIVPRMGVPLLIITLIASALVLAQLGVFRFVHTDDFRLREIVDGRSKLSPAEQQSELDRIYRETRDDKYPTTDRLVLVLKALAQVNPKKEGDPEAADMIRQLAGRDRTNLNLQSAVPDAMLQLNLYQDAEKEYQRLKLMKDRGEFRNNPAYVDRFELAAVRVAEKQGDFSTAADRLKGIYEKDPGNPALRNEYAGVLIGAGKTKPSRYKEAVNLLRDVPNLDVNGKETLVYALMLDNQYEEAEKQAQSLVSANRNDPKADKLLAEVYSIRNKRVQSREILDRLLAQNPNDVDLRVKIGQIELKQEKWPDALERFQTLFDANERDRPEVARGWIDAASSYAGPLTDRYRATADWYFDKQKVNPFRGEDAPVYMARLSWILQNMNEPDKSRYMLEQALSIKPNDPSIRDQLSGVLINAGEWEKAIEIMGGTNNIAARRLAVGVYIKNGALEKAELEARGILEQKPDDLETQKLVADIVSWRKDYDRALGLYEKMRETYPTDRSIQARMAEITLWKGGEYPAALARFTKLLEEDFDYQYPAEDRKPLKLHSQRIWDGFIDAAAGSISLDAAQTKVAMKVAEAKLKAEGTTNPLTLGRLAWVLLRGGDSGEAKAEANKLLTRAIALKPTDPAVRRELANVLAPAERYEEAVAMLEGMPKDDKDRIRLAFLYSGYRNFDKAEQEVNALLAKKPDDAGYLRMKADLMSWKGTPAEQEKALTAFEDLIRKFPNDPDLPIRLAEVLLWKKDYESAMVRFQTLLGQYPDNLQVWGGFAASAGSLNRPLPPETADVGRRLIDRAFVSEVSGPLLYARLAMLADKLKEPAKAELFVSRAVRNKPADPAQRRELAELFAGMGRAKEAVLMYGGLTLTRDDRKRLIYAASLAEDLNTAAYQARLLVQENPADAAAQRILADVLSWKGDYQESLTIYERLLRASRNDRTLRIDVADTKLYLNSYPEAMKKYGDLLTEQFDQEKLWDGFIDAVSSASLTVPISEEQKRLALQIFDRWMSLEKADPAKLSRLAWVMHKVKDDAKASVAVNRALAQNPQPPTIRRELAGVLAALKRNDEALALVRDLPNPSFNDRETLTALLNANGRFGEAVREIRALLREKPRDRDLQKQLANALLWDGKYREAEAIFSDLDATYPANTDPAVRADTRLKLAQSALWGGQAAAANTRFLELMREDPNRAVYISGYIDSLSGLKVVSDEQERAIRSIDARIDSFRAEKPVDQVRLLCNMGRIMAKLSTKGTNPAGDEARSKLYFMRALQLDPRSKPVWGLYAQSLAEMKKFGEAEPIYAALLVGDMPSLPPRSGN